MHSDEPGKGAATGWHDTSVDNEGEGGQEHVKVEEVGDFLAACFPVSLFVFMSALNVTLTNSGKFRPYMQNHNNSHAQRSNVRKIRCTLENDRITHVDVSCVTSWQDSIGALDGRLGADQST